MNKLSKEGMLHAEMGQRLGLSAKQSAKLQMQRRRAQCRSSNLRDTENAKPPTGVWKALVSEWKPASHSVPLAKPHSRARLQLFNSTKAKRDQLENLQLRSRFMRCKEASPSQRDTNSEGFTARW